MHVNHIKKREENKLCNHSLIKSLITKLNARIYFQTLWGLFSYVCPDTRLNYKTMQGRIHWLPCLDIKGNKILSCNKGN